MKYALVIPDGAADEAQASLGGRTPLQAARIPHMDEVARLGCVGRADNVPASLPSGSDVATMSLFGYDPLQFHTGRAPIEAAAQGIPLGPDDWAVRCNLVTVLDGVMKSFTAGQIPNDLGRQLMTLLQQHLGSSVREFFAGVSYRNLLICRGTDPQTGASQAIPFSRDTQSTPPHDITDQAIAPYLPTGPGSDLLRTLMRQSEPLFADVAENRARVARGELPATQAWLWGLGKRPALAQFASRFGVTGAMVTAVDLLRGLAVLLGWRVIEVAGATGYLDTNYKGKGEAAIAALRDVDFVVVHVEATDEASHEGSCHHKIEALERIDAEIVGPLHAFLKSQGPYRLLISPDHPTFLRTKTHSYGYVPFAMAGTGLTPDGSKTYDEPTAAAAPLVFDRGCELMPFFLGKS